MTAVRGAVLLTSLGLVGLLGVPATASAVSNDIEPRPSYVEHVPSIEGDEEALSLPIVDEEMHSLATRLTQQLADDPNFASAEVTRDRTQVIVHWWGEPTSALLDLLATAPSVSSVVEATDYRPGDLRDTAQELLSNHQSLSYAVAKFDGSGLEVGTSEANSTRKSGSLTFLDEVDVPVEVKSDGVAAANSRQTDKNYHLGGARISLFEDPFVKANCTSGFHVVKAGETSKQGIMFAAHCGAVESKWIVSDGTNAYNWGPIVARTTAYDGAIMNSGFSQPYIWTSYWDSTIYTQINGASLPYVGQELCYSGSYSGLSCGSVVQETNYYYNLGGDLTNVKGFRSVQRNGTAVAGNGDSGGPGYELVSTSSGINKRYAVGIISAIPSNSPANCQGVPGSALPGGRKCSPTVVATSVVEIGEATGWYVPIS